MNFNPVEEFSPMTDLDSGSIGTPPDSPRLEPMDDVLDNISVLRLSSASSIVSINNESSEESKSESSTY